MRNKVEKLILLILVELIMHPVFAQNNGSADAYLLVLTNAQNKAAETGSRSYQVSYRYSNESTPNLALDSLDGVIKSRDDKYYMKLGNTEMMHDSTYSLSIFEEDKILLLSRSKPKEDQLNPIRLNLDSTVKHYPGIIGSVTHNANDTIVKIKFPDSSWYKSISIYINSQTHLIRKVIYIVKTEALTEDSRLTEDLKNKYDSYARVEANFVHNNTSSLSDNVFDESSYFKKQGENYLPVGKYSSYRLIIGSSGL